MDIVVLKVISTAAVFVIAVAGIFASYKLRKFTKWFDIASAFSAGVIIATAYTHMLPEAIEQYQEYVSGPHNHAEPMLAHAVSGAALNGANGNAADSTTTPIPKKKCCHGHGAGHNHGHAHPHVHQAAASDSIDDHDHDHEHDHEHAYPLITFLAALSFLCLFLVERGAIIFMKNKRNHDRFITEDVKMVHDDSNLTNASDPHTHDHDHADHDHSNAINCCKDIKSLEKMSEFAAFALILAVSLHAVIEGMGMGSGTNSEVVLSTFIGVAVHKGLEGFAVGANLIEAAVSTRRFIMYSGVVCLASPLGALIGYLVTLGDARNGLVSPVLQALAVGTFIQVATMEFLPRTFAKPENFWLKAAGLVIGFGVMSTMPIWFEHSHEHH